MVTKLTSKNRKLKAQGFTYKTNEHSEVISYWLADENIHKNANLYAKDRVLYYYKTPIGRLIITDDVKFVFLDKYRASHILTSITRHEVNQVHAIYEEIHSYFSPYSAFDRTIIHHVKEQLKQTTKDLKGRINAYRTTRLTTISKDTQYPCYYIWLYNILFTEPDIAKYLYSDNKLTMSKYLRTELPKDAYLKDIQVLALRRYQHLYQTDISELATLKSTIEMVETEGLFDYLLDSLSFPLIGQEFNNTDVFMILSVIKHLGIKKIKRNLIHYFKINNRDIFFIKYGDKLIVETKYANTYKDGQF